MSKWTVNPAACASVFATADSDVTTLEAQRRTVSTKTDDACLPFADAKVKPIHSALLKVYNRVLTHEMTYAEAYAKHVAHSGKDAFNAYQQGHDDMAEDTERTANSIPEPRIQDGKAVPR